MCQECSPLILLSQQKMFFKEDSMQDFISYKLSNPQALQQQMKMIKDRQDCTKKLNQYSKQMQNLKNEYNMYKELYDASIAKKQYLQQTYEQNKVELDGKIAQAKEEIESNTKEAKEREARNQFNRKKYNDFQKEIAIKKDKLTEYHLTQLTSLSNHSQNLKKSLEQKRQRKALLEQQLKTLKDRQKIVEQTVQNSQKIRNKWTIKKNQLQKLREQQIHKEKQVRDQINKAASMQKVIYKNFYKKCTQIIQQMQNGLENLFKIQLSTKQGSNLQQNLDRLLQQQKNMKKKLLAYITEKREKYKINADLPQADAEVYNNIVQTNINSKLLRVINPSDYRNNDLILRQIEDGLAQMFEGLEIQREASLKREAQKIQEIAALRQRLKQFQLQIQQKRKQLSSPTKRSKKN